MSNVTATPATKTRTVRVTEKSLANLIARRDALNAQIKEAQAEQAAAKVVQGVKVGTKFYSNVPKTGELVTHEVVAIEKDTFTIKSLREGAVRATTKKFAKDDVLQNLKINALRTRMPKPVAKQQPDAYAEGIAKRKPQARKAPTASK